MRFAFRSLAKSPGFTVVAIAMLALGIGASTASFSLVNTFFLRPPPFERPHELASLHTVDERNPGLMALSHPNFVDYRAQNSAFTDLAFHWFANARWTRDQQTTTIFGELVSGNYFALLGVPAALGRTFTAEEDRTAGTHPVIVVSHAFWKSELGSDPAVLGRTLQLNATPFTVIGVAPENFRGVNLLNSPAFWLPAAMHRAVLFGTGLEFFETRRAVSVSAFGRLKPGVTLEQAAASLQPVAQNLATTYPADNAGRSVRLLPLIASTLNPNARTEFIRAGSLLLALAGVILLIACANLANLLLARAGARQREIALRIALGARRSRVLAQLFAESALLAVLGGALGLLVAHWIKDLLWALRPPGFPPDFHVALDGRVLAFALLVSLTTALLFGLVPAWTATRVDLIGVLKRESSTGSNRTPLFAIRNLLVAAQVALSVIALVIAGLFIRSLLEARTVDTGWNGRGLALLSVDLLASGYNPTRTLGYHDRAVALLKSVPGVTDASVSNRQFLGGRNPQRTIRPQGTDDALRTRGQLMSYACVMPNYLAFMGIPFVAGRDFTADDTDARPPVVIINETLARRAWPNADAVGKTIKIFGTETLVEVIGVVRDTVYHDLAGEPTPYVFFLTRQIFHANTVFHVRTAGDPAALLPTLRKELQSLDASVSIYGLRTMNETVRLALWGPRTGAALMSVFGGIALLLAALGVYAVMAYTVGQRTHEIGIRMAIGAQAHDVLRLVLQRGLVVTTAGVGLGLLLAFFVARHFRNFFFQVEPTDPLTYAVIALLLAAASLLACWLPARRATRVNPLTALRAE